VTDFSSIAEKKSDSVFGHVVLWTVVGLTLLSLTFIFLRPQTSAQLWRKSTHLETKEPTSTPLQQTAAESVTSSV
jgi:hypothetical protein